MNNLAFITLTNSGYLPYTLNCLKSLKNIGNSQLNSYAIGHDAYKRLSRKNIPAVLIDDDRYAGFETHRNGNFANVVLYKFHAIYENLKQHEFVCFTDGDIVFNDERFIDYCFNEIKDHDLLIQNDCMKNDVDKNLCSGFMFIKSNPTTLSYFNPETVVKSQTIREGWGDQTYINRIKKKLAFKKLPLELFPNGQYFYAHHQKINPYMVHFNWVKGHDKAIKIIKHTDDFYLGLLPLALAYYLKSLTRSVLKKLKH